MIVLVSVCGFQGTSAAATSMAAAAGHALRCQPDSVHFCSAAPACFPAADGLSGIYLVSKLEFKHYFSLFHEKLNFLVDFLGENAL